MQAVQCDVTSESNAVLKGMHVTLLCWSQVAGSICKVTRGEDVKAAEAECERCDYVVMDALDWKIIPAENLVAAFQVCACPTWWLGCPAAVVEHSTPQKPHNSPVEGSV